MKAICAYCGNEFEKSAGHLNRAIKQGLNVYCNKKCSGLGRRTNETEGEKKVYKQWYDLFIRASRSEDEYWEHRLLGALIFHMDYATNPEKYRMRRKEKQKAHNAYCRQPEYKVYKKKYDEQYRAKKDYGEYWECAILLKNLDSEIDYRESKRQNKIYNKSTSKRKRKWQNQEKQNLKQSLKSLQQLI